MQAGTYRPNADKITVKEYAKVSLTIAGRNQRDERMTRKMPVVTKGT
jgi:hypothetical protein